MPDNGSTPDRTSWPRRPVVYDRSMEACVPNALAFVSYVLVTTFTPGPNNIMSMANACKFGFRRTLRFTAGVCLGFFLVVGLSIAFAVALFRVIPAIKPVMTVIGAAYILWLAWKTVTSSPHDDSAAGQNTFASGRCCSS